MLWFNLVAGFHEKLKKSSKNDYEEIQLVKLLTETAAII